MDIDGVDICTVMWCDGVNEQWRYGEVYLELLWLRERLSWNGNCFGLGDKANPNLERSTTLF